MNFLVRYNDLVPILQAAVSPVILISGVGLLLLSITNRYGRIIDRSRSLADALRKAPLAECQRYSAQLQVLLRRAYMARTAITFGILSVLMAGILVISLFFTAVFHLEIALLSVVLFIACIASLITALIFLLWEVNLSLAALKLEIASIGQTQSPKT